MTRRRWIADDVSGNRAVLLGTHAQPLSRVLRAKVGQEFDITAGDKVRRGRITAIKDDHVEFELGDEVPAPVPLQVTLALAIFKFDRMEWAIEKCTELGVARIIPVIARRTETHLATAAVKRTDRWRKIALQATEQSRRIFPPEISLPLKIKDVLSLRASLRILLSEAEADVTLRDVLHDHPSRNDVVLAVGPEGGWTVEESELFQQAGWLPAALGGTILRAETAAIAALAVALAELQP
jgi:16S rRNA (uracil1498-N3)-methyltransferase